MIITIDGPTASGKSTVARAVAHRLSIYYLCSGLLFRGLAYILLRDKKYTLETIALCKRSDAVLMLNPLLFEYDYQDGKERIIFNSNDITPQLKNSVIDQASSLLSTNAYVRPLLIEYQRNIAERRSLVADGRDTGSVVFPQADYKFFLTASLQKRASRWQKDQEKRGTVFTLQQAIDKVNERDMRDSQRAIAPLVVPQDAIVIDSTNLSVEDVVNKIMTTLPIHE